MVSFYDYAVPLFLVVFLIICFLAYTWRRQLQSEAKVPEKAKPVRLNPYKTSEGFQARVTAGSWVTAPSGTQRIGYNSAGGTSRGGSGSIRHWKTQFDLDPRAQFLYGRWEETSFDSFYDAYEENELRAVAVQASKFNDFSPAPRRPPDFGSTIGAFDSDATKISWDTDNSAFEQSDVVWGYVSEQASRSIFLRTYVNEIANNIARLEPCSPDTPTNYCYTAPMLNVTTTDTRVSNALQVTEGIIQGAGMLPMIYLSQINLDLSNFSEIVSARYATMSNFFGVSKDVTSHDLGKIETNKTPLGESLGVAVGPRKVSASMEAQRVTVKKNMMQSMSELLSSINLRRAAITGAVSGLAIGANVVNFFTAGAATAAAAGATTAAVIVDIFFGIIGGICMAIQAILDPIIMTLYKTGGECPQGYRPFSAMLSSQALSILSAFIPIIPFFVTFDPYVCWGTDSNGIANVRMRVPPRMPAFMSDRSLSLVYHAAWQSGQSANLPSGTILSAELDPLPAGYKWLPDSDLAGLPNSNEIVKIAMAAAQSSSGTRSNLVTSGSTGSGKLPSFIAVQTCQGNTTPSADGKFCLQSSQKTAIALPVVTVQCPTGSFDDGFNCWSRTLSENCNGGQFIYTTTQTWNDTTGYYAVSSTAPTCADGTIPTITTSYKDRISCPAGYEKNTSTTTAGSSIPPTDLLCYQICPPNHTRQGALCLGAVPTTARNYMFGSTTLYREQALNTNLITDISQVTFPYCDFGSSVMLDRMGQFYYNNSLLNPTVNEDGSITVEMIDTFYGVTASSELSCDVACSITFITYDPISGGGYKHTRGCKAAYKDDPTFRDCPFCFRRFYFIRGANDVQGQFTVSGCTFADYTALEAMVQSTDDSTNFLVSLPKRWSAINKENVNIVDMAAFNAAWKNGQIMAQAGVGLLEAGISIAGGMLGVGLGMGVASAAARSAVTKGASSTALVGMAAEEAATLSSSVVNAIRTAARTSAGDVDMIDDAAMAAVRANGNLDAVAARAFVSETMTNMRWPIAEAAANIGGGIVGGTAAGLGTSMWLDPILQKAINAAINPAILDNVMTATIVGTSYDTLRVAINQNWWVANTGPIYEMAPGYHPNIQFCEKTKISASYCTYKKVVRDMVNRYHNTYQNAHIKEILEIEPRGDSACYYKWNEVTYDPVTNIEGTQLNEVEWLITNEIKDYATCTYAPTGMVPVSDNSVNGNSAYKVRSYIDPATSTLSSPKIIYPTRTIAYKSDLYARYVRVCPPLAGTTGRTDGYINLAQLSVFDISGFNISTQMNTYATSVAPGAGSSEVAVGGSIQSGDSLDSVWQPVTQAVTEYWEVDLGKTVNIAEVVYFGGNIATGRSIGVRIQFLYTNGLTDTPILTYTLPSDAAIQMIPLYSSSTSVPMYPLGGPIKIPRPLPKGVFLGSQNGCINKCEDRGIIDSLISQYNNTNTNSSIVKILRGTTSSASTCEYEAEVLTTDSPSSGSGMIKNSLTTQLLSMELTANAPQGTQPVLARYVKLIPSFTPGTILEVSKIIVVNVDRRTNPPKNYYVSLGANPSQYNMFWEQAEMSVLNGGDSEYLNFLLSLPTGFDGSAASLTALAKTYPNTFRAGNNAPDTHILIDLAPPSQGSGIPANYEIAQILVVGATGGGINMNGIEIQLYADQPTNQVHASDGTYSPVFRSVLSTTNIVQSVTIIPPPMCTFNLTKTTPLYKPGYLQPNTPPLSAPDTSGGVFSYSSLVNAVGSAWNALMPIDSKTSIAPIQANAAAADAIVRKMLDETANLKTLYNSGAKCSDPKIMNLMILAYNILKGAKDTDDFGVTKNTMTRILRSGQSTLSSCDVLFENMEEYYEQYIKDIPASDKSNRVKSISSARFTFNKGGNNIIPFGLSGNTAIPDQTLVIYDISANAIGIVSDTSTITPAYAPTSPQCGVLDCRSAPILQAIKTKLTSSGKTATKSRVTTATGITRSFQSTPLSCEYRVTKTTTSTTLRTNISASSTANTYVKALFALNSDGCTPTVPTTITEYDPATITFSNDNEHACVSQTVLQRSCPPGTEVILPSLWDYSTTAGSNRVNTIVQAV